jgi:PPOX class probable F420-dependent enzyme
MTGAGPIIEPMPTLDPAVEAAPLPDRVRAFLDQPLFLTLTTVDPDGTPWNAVVWYGLEPDGRIIVNSADGRRWPANLRREARVALSVIDPADGYRWIWLSGVVERIDDEQAIAQADIAGLARRYHADDPETAERLIQDRFRRQHRVSFRIRATAVHDHLE